MKKFINVIAISFVFYAFFFVVAQAANENYGNITCKYVRNYDGDTITVTIPGVHSLLGEKIGVRINGIDTPEIKGSRGSLKEQARNAKRLTESLCRKAQILELRNMRRGKYFRIIADVYADGQSVAEALIKNNLAKPYDGGKKPSWNE